MKGFMSVKEAAEKWGISQRWVNQYALDGRIPGCERFGNVWVIPENAKKAGETKAGGQKKQTGFRPRLTVF